MRYGIWLARETGAPLAFSGGIGHAQVDGLAEAQIAARIALQDYGRPLKWVEDESRDTRENAAAPSRCCSGRDHAHRARHPRLAHAARDARFRAGRRGSLRIEAAPMGLAQTAERPALLWIPSPLGNAAMNHVLHELAGLAAGA